jgi:hypothetical protein
MKLRMLVVAVVGCLGLPVMAHAQGDTTTKAMSKDTTMKDTTATRRTRRARSRARMEASSMAVSSDTTAAHPVPPSDGTTCPWKCPTSKGAAGLTGVQFLALQQELRDRGCGNAHVTGSLDAPTRRAISVCAKRLGVANNAAAVLAAFNVGFAASELGTATGMGGGAMAAEGSKAEEAKESPRHERAERRAAAHKSTMKMKTDTAMKKDTGYKR